MTVKECYDIIGGNYDEVFSRLRTDERVKKFLLKFPNDPSFDLLRSSLEERNIEEAFRASHTLKGICQNLALEKLYRSSNALTEMLRGQTEYKLEYDQAFEQVRVDYLQTKDGILLLEN